MLSLSGHARASLTALALAPVIALLCACSGSQISPSSGYGAEAPFDRRLAAEPGHHAGPLSISSNDLFVGFQEGSSFGVAVLQNGTFKELGTFSVFGLPHGSWVDSHGLYIAVQGRSGGGVFQYKSPGTQWSFAYTANVSLPNAVTTDSLGNVYEADAAGLVNEYAQRKNVVKASCSVAGSGSVRGIAVDSLGDVFAAYYNGSVPQIVEITDFTSCFSQLLGVKLTSFGGMVLDNGNNLIVCDPFNKTVDIIKPPYSSVSRHLGSGFKAPINVAINAANSRAYVVDQGTSAVYVLYYPSGKHVATITGTSVRPWTAVDGSNYVP